MAQVLYNGVQLNFSDFTATNGTTIVLASPVALADDVVTVILWGAVTSSSLVGTAAAFDTGVTTGTIPFAEDVVLVDASGNVDIAGTVTADGLTVDGAVDLNGNLTVGLPLPPYCPGTILTFKEQVVHIFAKQAVVHYLLQLTMALAIRIE